VPCTAKQTDGFQPADKADAIVFMDAHPANGVNALRTLNPSIVNDDKPFDPPDPALDPFNPKNGFNPNGESHYKPDFVEAYSKAQSARMNRLIDKALALHEAMKNGTHFPSDDDVFTIYRTDANLRQLGNDVYDTTTQPRVLLKNDGSKDPPQIIHSVIAPDPKLAEDDKKLVDAYPLTVKSFLSSRAIRSKQALDDVDWCSSNNSVPCSIRRISLPMLMMSAQGYWFVRDAETIFDSAKSTDKELIYIEGAAHGFIPCVPCDRSVSSGVADPNFDLRRAASAGNYQGKYTNVTKNTFDYIDRWIKARF
jgi:hypothetical protein